MADRMVLALVLTLGAATFTQGVACAQTIDEALASTYENNKTLSAQRASLRATDEQVPQALSGWRPTVSATVEAGRTYQDANSDLYLRTQDGTTFNRAYVASITQPLFRGGQTLAATRAAENTVLAQRAQLHETEQTVLLDAATAYADVYRDQAVLDLTISNEQRLIRQLQATRDRFQVGEVTRTDVSQAEARVARATADRISAEGDLARSRATYRAVVGSSPNLLPRPPVPGGVPTALNEINDLAIDSNPVVVSAAYQERSALDNVDQVRGQLLPEVSLIGRVERDKNVSNDGERLDSASATVRLTMPLYQSGDVYSRLRESKQLVSQQRQRLYQSQLDSVRDATRAWNSLETARAAIGSYKKEVEANEIALEGVQREAEVGARTVLDVLDAQQELLQSQVSLVRSERDEVVAAYQVKSAIGQLTARQLGLKVDYYDPSDHYRDVRDLWFGGSSKGDSSSDFSSPTSQR
ncbi:MAG: TolC family outer membrane protein [Rhodospirillales bacterium]|nr:TolC family outer membrane protein [Rhodospirillales bacterium]